MPTLEKIALSARELSDLGKIRDSYTAEIESQNEKLRTKLDAFWQDVRAEYDLKDDPYHFLKDCIWVLRDATQHEKEAFGEMTKYK